MKGKVGLIIGLGVGYVLGTRAGRERYEQIKQAAQKVWNLPPVQTQVGRAKGFAKSSAMLVPKALWSGAVKVTKAMSEPGSPSERIDRGVDAGRKAAPDVKDAVETAVDDADKAGKSAAAAAKRTSKASQTSTKKA